MSELDFERLAFSDVFTLWLKYRNGFSDVNELDRDFTNYLRKYKGTPAEDLSTHLMNATVDASERRMESRG